MEIKYVDITEENIIRAIISCNDRVEKYINDYAYASEGHQKKLSNQIEIEIVKIQALNQLFDRLKSQNAI